MGGGIGVPPILELAKQMKCEKSRLLSAIEMHTFLKEEFEQNGDLIYFHRGWKCGNKGKCHGCYP